MTSTGMVTYEMAKEYPIGTVAEDVEGYWAQMGRRYVKTGPSTWAVFWEGQPWSDHDAAVAVGRNNLSPCPIGHLRVTEPAPRRMPQASDDIAAAIREGVQG